MAVWSADTPGDIDLRHTGSDRDPDDTTRAIDGADHPCRPLILSTEPNPFTTEFLRAILSPFEVISVAPGDLVETVRRSRPVLVISELLLKGADGFELCRLLKQGADTSETPVLIFSVLDAAPEASEAGADAFLRKPADRRKLLSEVARLARYPSPHGPDRTSSFARR